MRRRHRSARWLRVFCFSPSQRGARTRRAGQVAFAVAQGIERTRHAGQVLLRHLQIPCRVSDRLMPQQDLDGAQVFARFQKMRGEGMPERVDSHTTGDAKFGGGAVDSATDGIRAELLARVLPREQQRPWRFGQPPIVAQSFEQPLRQRSGRCPPPSVRRQRARWPSAARCRACSRHRKGFAVSLHCDLQRAHLVCFRSGLCFGCDVPSVGAFTCRRGPEELDGCVPSGGGGRYFRPRQGHQLQSGVGERVGQ